MLNKLQHATPFSATATDATAAAATVAGVAGSFHYVTDVQASSDKAGAIMLVKQGSTTIWQVQMPANGNVHHTFASPLRGAKGAAVSVEVDGTAACKANIAGFTI